jgi:hypothetical protein
MRHAGVNQAPRGIFSFEAKSNGRGSDDSVVPAAAFIPKAG